MVPNEPTYMADGFLVCGLCYDGWYRDMGVPQPEACGVQVVQPETDPEPARGRRNRRRSTRI